MKKKCCCLLLALMLILPLLSLASSDLSEHFTNLPVQFQSFQPSGYRLMDGVQVKAGVAYLLFHNGADYYLYILKQDSNGQWQRLLRSNKVLPAGQKAYSLDANSPLSLTIRQGEDISYTYESWDGIWKIVSLWQSMDGSKVLIRYLDDQIAFNNMSTGKEQIAYGVYQRELRYLNVSALPTSYQEARDRLSQVPTIPSGELQAKRIKFAGNQRFPVYSGPGQLYDRAAAGKAVVSTNDWIQVFGTEDGWALIQYDISSDHMRFGYIEAMNLPKNARVAELNFSPRSMQLNQDAWLTDDPLFSKPNLIYLQKGQEVTRLSGLGKDWAYIELVIGSILMRGFVPASTLENKPSLALSPTGDFQAIVDGFGYQAKGIVDVETDGITVSIAVYALFPAEWEGSAPGVDRILGYRLYEGNRASHLLVPQPSYQGLSLFSFQGKIQPDVPVLGLVPVYSASGERVAESLVIPIK